MSHCASSIQPSLVVVLAPLCRRMPIGSGGSNKAQKEVVNKKGKKNDKELDDDDIAFKKKQQEQAKKDAELAAKLKAKK